MNGVSSTKNAGSFTSGHSKILIAPKLQTNGLKSDAIGMGSSSILNLPVLGQENVLLPTNRALKGMDSSKQLQHRNEDGKISGSMPAPKNNSVYFSRVTNTNAGLTPELVSPTKTGGDNSSRNMSMINIKKSQGRFLSPLNDSGSAVQASGQGIINSNVLKPPSLIEKYPNTVKPDGSLL